MENSDDVNGSLKYKKIYVACPNVATSGGGETLHQLVNIICELGEKAYIYNFEKKNTLKNVQKFQKYHVSYITKIEDNSENLLIVPETYTFLLKKYKKIQKVIWWLSLDFYLNTLPIYKVKSTLQRYHLSQIFLPLVFGFTIIKHPLSTFTFKFKEKNIFHFYNCEYVKNFLIENNVSIDKMLYLCGPLRDEYFNDKITEIEKENIIAYNPKKGIKFTEKLINAINTSNINVSIVAIENMHPYEIVQLLKKSKLYIDFGEFPGPERLPREAVMMNCAIITSRNGSAGNNQKDVPIPLKYKIDAKEENIAKIIELIKDILENYEDYKADYTEYRKK